MQQLAHSQPLGRVIIKTGTQRQCLILPHPPNNSAVPTKRVTRPCGLIQSNWGSFLDSTALGPTLPSLAGLAEEHSLSHPSCLQGNLRSQAAKNLTRCIYPTPSFPVCREINDRGRPGVSNVWAISCGSASYLSLSPALGYVWPAESPLVYTIKKKKEKKKREKKTLQRKVKKLELSGYFCGYLIKQ